MSRVAPMMKAGSVAVALILVLMAATTAARADPCVQGCRGEHNACRMAAKLLMSARCDDQLMSCISRCMAGGARDFRRNDGPRDMRPREFDRPRDFDRPHGMWGGREMRGPDHMGGPRGWR